MALDANNDRSDSPVVIGRRSARLSVIVPLTIRGVASNGKAFKENTWTISVNKQGARLFAFHEPSVGDEITLENPVLGRTAKGRVVRVCEKRFPEDPYEIAIELADAQNVWGVKFPPEDWQRERPVASASHPPAKAAQTPVPSQGSNVPASGETRAEEANRLARGPEQASNGANDQAEKFDQVSLAITGLSRFARQAEGGADRQAAPGDERPFGQKEPLSTAYYLEALRLLEDRIERVYTLERDFEALGSRIENSRAELEGLLSKIRGAEGRWDEEAERIRHDIQEASEQALKSSLETAKLKIQKDIVSASSAAIEGAQKRFQEESRTGSEEFLRTLQGRVAGFTMEAPSKLFSELRARADELVEKAKAEITCAMEAHMVGLRDNFRKLAEEMSSSHLSEAEKSLRTAGESITAKLAESLKGRAEGALREQEAVLHQKLGEISKELATDFRMNLADLSTEALEGSQNYTEIRFRSLKAEVDEALSKTQEQHLTEAADRLRKLSEEVFQTLAAQLQKATGGEVERIREGLVAAVKEQAFEDLRQELRAVGQATLDALLLDAKATSEECRAHLRKVLLEFQEQSERDLGAHFQSILDRQREAFREQLRIESSAASERILGEIKTSTERIAKEASDTIYKQVGLVTVAMKGWSDDTRTQVESYCQKSLADLQQRVREFSRASMSAYYAELRFLAKNLSAPLEEACRLFKGVEKVLTVRPDEPPEGSTPKFSTPEIASLELSAEELRARQEQSHSDISGFAERSEPDSTNEPQPHANSPNLT